MDSCWIIHLPGFLNSGNIHNRNVDVFEGFVTNNFLQWLPTLIPYYDQSMRIMTYIENNTRKYQIYFEC